MLFILMYILTNDMTNGQIYLLKTLRLYCTVHLYLTPNVVHDKYAHTKTAVDYTMLYIYCISYTVKDNTQCMFKV